MTDQQIVNFVIGRTKKNSRSAGIKNPKLVFYFASASRVYLSIQSETSKVFFIRYIWKECAGLFKIKSLDKSINDWMQQVVASKKDRIFPFCIEYTVDDLPKELKHYVSYSIIQTLMEKDCGIDIIQLDSNSNAIEIISSNETYEEAAIESDLMSIDDY